MDVTAESDLDRTFIPRPSVPLEPLKLPPLPGQQSPQPTPRVAYPIRQPTQRPAVSARETAQKNIQQEVAQLNQKTKTNLDQLIQQAVNLQMQLGYQPKPTSAKPKEKKPLVITPMAKPVERVFWWPEENQIKKLPPKKVAVTPAPSIVAKSKPVPPAAKTRAAVQVVTKVPPKLKKTAGTGPFLFNYLLFSISLEEDPFHDPNRRKIIYLIKTLGYLVTIGAIWEIRRYLQTSFDLNGMLEVVSILFIAGILFFFGENFNILFKPVNPFQVHEVV